MIKVSKVKESILRGSKRLYNAISNTDPMIILMAGIITDSYPLMAIALISIVTKNK